MKICLINGTGESYRITYEASVKMVEQESVEQHR